MCLSNLKQVRNGGRQRQTTVGVTRSVAGIVAFERSNEGNSQLRQLRWSEGGCDPVACDRWTRDGRCSRGVGATGDSFRYPGRHSLGGGWSSHVRLPSESPDALLSFVAIPFHHFAGSQRKASSEGQLAWLQFVGLIALHLKVALRSDNPWGVAVPNAYRPALSSCSRLRMSNVLNRLRSECLNPHAN